MTQIKAIPTKTVGGVPSDDGKHGLIKFVRENPAPNGDVDFWVGVPTKLLPYLAAIALKLIPQPERGLTGNHPAVLSAESIQLSQGPAGQIVLTLELEKGARLSFELDTGQAQLLSEGLAFVLGTSAPTPPPSTPRN